MTALWSAADARYSTVRWTANNRAVYAIGPTNVDPRTGEILNADILISAAWIQRWRGQSGQYVAPDGRDAVGAAGRFARAGGAAPRSRLCRYGGRDDARQGALARAVMAARGEIPAGAEASRRVRRPGAQGAGDARGRAHPRPAPQLPRLRRRQRGAAGQPELDRLARPGRLGDGLQPARARRSTRAQQGDYHAPTIGTYDRWAITYGYPRTS